MHHAVDQKETVIRPESGLSIVDIPEVYRFRHMLFSLIRRNMRLQFDSRYLTFFWATSRPLAMLAVFAFIKHQSGANMHINIPYPLYLYSGLVFWFFFLEAVSSASRSIQRDASLITKIYFPRLITPLAHVLSGLQGFAISMIPLVIMMVCYQVHPGWRILMLPLVVLQCVVLSAGIGMVFASLTILSKDWDNFLSLMLYLGIFVSPVIFGPDMIPARAQTVYFANPMAGTLLAFRSCLFSDFPFPAPQWTYSIVVSLAALVIGAVMFRRSEVLFGDRL